MHASPRNCASGVQLEIVSSNPPYKIAVFHVSRNRILLHQDLFIKSKRSQLQNMFLDKRTSQGGSQIMDPSFSQKNF